jgi:H+/gluconate symporter-like permease
MNKLLLAVNPNPGITVEKVPQPADYSWLITLGIVVLIVGLLALTVYVKFFKKKKRPVQAEEPVVETAPEAEVAEEPAAEATEEPVAEITE